jgi:hypothetical protein
MARPDAQYPVLIWALTIRGEMMAVHCTTRAEALEIGRANVASGAWRTWDAFESAGDAEVIEARRIASSSALEESPKSPRPRILADWAPPEPPAAEPAVPVKPRVPTTKVPTVKETLKGFRAGVAAQEKPMATGTRRQRVIPD